MNGLEKHFITTVDHVNMTAKEFFAAFYKYLSDNKDLAKLLFKVNNWRNGSVSKDELKEFTKDFFEKYMLIEENLVVRYTKYPTFSFNMETFNTKLTMKVNRDNVSLKVNCFD